MCGSSTRDATTGTPCPDGCEPDCTLTLGFHLVSGAKLVVKDGADATKRKIVFVSKDPAIDTTPPAGIDPLGAGASLQVYNSNGGGDAACFPLPAGEAFWRAGGDPANPVFTYRDGAFANGPCKVAVAKDGKLLEAQCLAKVAPIPFTPDEASQGSVAVRFASGGTVYCFAAHGLPVTAGRVRA